MPGGTPIFSLPYPLPSEVFQRQHIQDLAEATDFVLSSTDVDRVESLQRPRGMLGTTLPHVLGVNTLHYMGWNIDSLDDWWTGGAPITTTQGPTLPTGLYLFTFHAVITAFSHPEASYFWMDAEFEVGGARTLRRTHTMGLNSSRVMRLSGPVRVPPGSPQQVKMRVYINGTTGGSSLSFGRNLFESSPRFGWTQVATG